MQIILLLLSSIFQNAESGPLANGVSSGRFGPHGPNDEGADESNFEAFRLATSDEMEAAVAQVLCTLRAPARHIRNRKYLNFTLKFLRLYMLFKHCEIRPQHKVWVLKCASKSWKKDLVASMMFK